MPFVRRKDRRIKKSSLGPAPHAWHVLEEDPVAVSLVFVSHARGVNQQRPVEQTSKELQRQNAGQHVLACKSTRNMDRLHTRLSHGEGVANSKQKHF